MNAISESDTQAIVRSAFGPDRILVSSIPLTGGLINSTRMLVLDGDERSVLRVAPDRPTAEAGPSWLTAYGLRREAAALSQLSSLGMLMPQTVAFDFESTVIDRDWVIQRVMPGVPLSTVEDMLPDETRETIWHETGAATRAMHDQSAPFFGAPAWGSEHAHWSDLILHDVAGCVDDADRFGLDPQPFRRLLDLVKANLEVLDQVTRPSLIHSDLFAPHLFVVDDDEDGSLHLAGIIDLEFARFADPRSEHLVAQAMSGHDDDLALAAFREGYGSLPDIPGGAERQAIYQALDHAWNITLAAFQQRDSTDAMTEFTQAINRMESA